MKKLRTAFPKSRIKAMMQKDDEVGKIASDVPLMISRGVELFLEDLVRETLAIAESRNGKTLNPSHLKHCVLNSKKFDFLSHLVEEVPDLPAKTDAPEEGTKPARKRKSVSAPGDDAPVPKKPRAPRKKKEQPVPEEDAGLEEPVPAPQAAAIASPSRLPASSTSAFAPVVPAINGGGIQAPAAFQSALQNVASRPSAGDDQDEEEENWDE